MTARHVLVVLAGVLLCFGPCALVYNTWSIFVVPVSESLGAASSQFTAFITVIYLIGALAVPFAGNLMERFDLRIVLSASVLLVAGGMAACSLWTEVWQFYVSGVIEGAGIVSLMFLAVPTLINRWFRVRTGFFIGLCFAMSGVGGAVWSMVGGALMSAASWRVAYLVFAAVVLVVALPATALFIRSYPEEAGCVPFGAAASTEVPSGKEERGGLAAEECSSGDEAFPDAAGSLDGSGEAAAVRKEWGVPARVMFRSPAFYLLMVCMGIFNALTVVANLYASYIHHLGAIGAAGITPEGAIMMASSAAACLMVVSALSKVGLGALSDKSMVVSLVVACGCGAASVLCMWIGSSAVAFICAGALLGGVLYAAIDALGAAFTRRIVGPREYTRIYSRVGMFVNIAGAFAATAFAMVAEVSWEAEWIMALCLIALAFVLGLSAIRLGRTLEQTYE